VGGERGSKKTSIRILTVVGGESRGSARARKMALRRRHLIGKVQGGDGFVGSLIRGGKDLENTNTGRMEKGKCKSDQDMKKNRNGGQPALPEAGRPDDKLGQLFSNI